MIRTIKNLFDSINLITRKYDAISKITGENFNVFRLLKMETSEVHLHSAFIAELLNPKGSHGQREVFLKRFIEIFSIASFYDDQLIVDVLVEEHKGKVNNDLVTGGRIDIVVKSKTNDRIILIENKINAGDQDSQLLRYKNEYPNAHLIYLTLDGKEPDSKSIADKKLGVKLKSGFDFYTASYYHEITKWLILCRKEAATHAILRETISQYINLIKYLTGQTMIQEMQDEIVGLLISNADNISAAIELNKNLYAAKKKLLYRFAEAIGSAVKKEFTSLEIEISKDFGDKFQGIYFSFENKVNKLQLSFLTQNVNEPSTYLEIINDKNGECGKKEENIKFYKEKLENKCGNWGKIENVEKAWLGDWVCRYTKLDNHLRNTRFWSYLADHNFSDASDVSEDIITILKILR